MFLIVKGPVRRAENVFDRGAVARILSDTYTGRKPGSFLIFPEALCNALCNALGMVGRSPRQHEGELISPIAGCGIDRPAA